MANPFEVSVPNPLQALMSFDQSYDAGRKRVNEQKMQAARLEAGNALASGADPRSALAKLLSIGDVQGARTIAEFGNNQRDFTFRQQEAERAQKNADRAYEKPQLIKGPNDEFIEYSPGKPAKVVAPVGAATPVNPYAAPGGQTEGQANASLYASRMFNSEKVLRDTENVGTDWQDRFWTGVGNKVGYNLSSPDFQKFDQARRDFINATLRRESGAVINPDEFDNANKQYFPMPGDSKTVIEQKRRNRADAIKGIAGAAGKNYRPENVFDASGNIVPNPQIKGRGGVDLQMKPSGLPAGVTPSLALSEAKAAIASGKNPEAIKARLQSWGIDTSGL